MAGTDSGRAAFASAARAYEGYEAHACGVIGRMRWAHDTLPEEHRALMPGRAAHFAQMEACAGGNQRVLSAVAAVGHAALFPGAAPVPEGPVPAEVESVAPPATGTGTTRFERLLQKAKDVRQAREKAAVAPPPPSEIDHDRVRSILRHLARDWSDEGRAERAACYTPLLNLLADAFPEEGVACRSGIKVLVPGCGLGRLAYEISRAGFAVEGNEISAYVLMAAGWVLNECPTAEAHVIHPYLHQTANVMSREDMLRGIRIPDVAPAADGAPPSGFGITAGDFLSVYTAPEQAGAWDAVATSFFIDTGRNVFAYIDAIAQCLKAGGRWVNVGPLLYHFSEVQSAACVELTAEELFAAMEARGFRVVWRGTAESTYAANAASMLTVSYRSVCFHAVWDGVSPS
eukprot:TRINITY_DN25537_c0_g1_i1.p1 TRINITY_DN25537_c0_g1~~TRINITY_DN25537_c0_g1_i1.p1  ORF type:complete len:402 (+),score=83.75 TRINITY_DN25537_c0_g1_i1:55-1260(+)